MLQPPNVVGLKLCQQVIVEEESRNVTLVNCFRKLSFAEFPAKAVRFFICVVLRDGKGEGTLTLAINSLVDLEEVWSRSWRLAFTDPLAERWFAVPVDDCEFPEEGSYEVELAADGDPIGRALIQVSVQG